MRLSDAFIKARDLWWLRNKRTVSFRCLFWFHANTNKITHLNAIAKFNFDRMQQIYHKTQALYEVTHAYTPTIDSQFVFNFFLHTIKQITRHFAIQWIIVFTTQSTWTFKQIKICDSTKRSRINQLLLGAVSIYYLNEFLFLHFFHFIAFNCRICCYYSHICKRICDHQEVKSHLFLRHLCYHWPFGMSCIYIGCQHLTENNF